MVIIDHNLYYIYQTSQKINSSLKQFSGNVAEHKDLQYTYNYQY